MEEVLGKSASLIKSGKKALGNAVDDGTDLVGAGLDKIGLDSVADKVRKSGDSLADQLGATPDEKDLGETEDPKELIHGEPATIRDRGARLKSLGDHFEQGANGLRGLSVGDWSGMAADSFHQRLNAEIPKWRTAADSSHTASTALTTFATAVEWSQGQAKEAIRLWKDALKKHDAWVAECTRKVNEYNDDVDDYNAGRSDVKPTQPDLGTDPAPPLKAEAVRILNAARAHRNVSASACAGVLNGAAAAAPPIPPGSERLSASLTDMGSVYLLGASHNALGLLNAGTNFVKFARTVLPFNPYNLLHPAEYARNQVFVVAGLIDVATDPSKFVTGMVATGWKTDPGAALGETTGNILLSVVPMGPKGTAGASALKVPATIAR